MGKASEILKGVQPIPLRSSERGVFVTWCLRCKQDVRWKRSVIGGREHYTCMGPLGQRSIMHKRKSEGCGQVVILKGRRNALN